MGVVMAVVPCNRCHFTFQMRATPAYIGTTPTFEVDHSTDPNLQPKCVSPPAETCPHLRETREAAYKAGKLR
jgi:hypothetical protein